MSAAEHKNMPARNDNTDQDSPGKAAPAKLFAMRVISGSVTNRSPSARQSGAAIKRQPSKSLTETPEKERASADWAAMKAEHKHVSHKAQAAPCLSGSMTAMMQLSTSSSRTILHFAVSFCEKSYAVEHRGAASPLPDVIHVSASAYSKRNKRSWLVVEPFPAARQRRQHWITLQESMNSN